MCGIFGTVRTSRDHSRMLAIFNESRGSDSAGFLFDGNRLRVDRSITKAILDRGVPERMWNHDVILGHTRSKTHGAASKQNAHPFRYGNIVGAHNGVISNFHTLKWKYKDKLKGREKEFDKMDVDSQIIFWLLNEKGTDGLREIDGYAAIWWVDLRDQSKFYTWTWANQYAVCENTILDRPCLAFSSDKDHLLLAGFKQPEIIPGDGTLITYDVKKARRESTVIVPGEQQRKRGEWRNGVSVGYLNYEDDEELARRAGVPMAYRGGSAGEDPTRRTTGAAPFNISESGDSRIVPVIDRTKYIDFFFCEKCNKIMPSEIMKSGEVTGDKYCPKCNCVVEGIHVTDAEWFFDNMPDVLMDDDEQEAIKKKQEDERNADKGKTEQVAADESGAGSSGTADDESIHAG